MDAVAKGLPILKELLTIIGLCIILPGALGAILFFVLRYMHADQKKIREDVLLLSQLVKTQGETQAAAVKTLIEEAHAMTEQYTRIAVALEGLPEKIRHAWDQTKKRQVG